MNIYFIQSEKSQVEKFGLLRDAIKLKRNTKEIKDIIAQMLEAIGDRIKIELLSNQYPIHFSSSVISWQMEYDIASKILIKERHSENLTYVFELINYSFYYLLLPRCFRNTFFLLHGMTVGNNISEWKKLVDKVRVNRYIIYKGSQELLSSYLCSGENLSGDDLVLIEQLHSFYNIDTSINLIANDNSTCFLQISDRKR